MSAARKPDWSTSDNRVRLFLGDCLEILPILEAVDCVVTDPPYNVGIDYGPTTDDRRPDYAAWCGRWGAMCLELATTVAISCGIANVGLWSTIKTPVWIIAWHKPAAMGRCPVGFNNWEPVVLYGEKPPDAICDVFKACIVPDDRVEGHPCPKPLDWALWQVSNFSDDSATVLDPFMGSGTTGVACLRTGRRFIGIEREPKYFEIAKQRIIAELSRHPLFEPAPEVQPELFA